MVAVVMLRLAVAFGDDDLSEDDESCSHGTDVNREHLHGIKYMEVSQLGGSLGVVFFWVNNNISVISKAE